jgi:acyl-homoserine-lactone acylase
MRASMRYAVLACPVAAVLAAASACTALAADGAVEIRRTAHGVAHIQAADYESLGYGVAYAHAEDNVCQTADFLVTVRGERSKFFGAGASGLLGLRTMPNEQIDLFIKAHMDDTAITAAHDRMSADMRALARGYVAGYNRFLADNAATLPVPCKGAPWVKPMTLAEYYRMDEQTMILAGIALFADAWLGARPPAAAPTSFTPALDRALSALDIGELKAIQERTHLGSNGWGFGAEATPDGHGMLLGNPHFPWYGMNRFWQAHLTIPGELDVMGASISNAAFIHIGFNKDVAWTHTVSTGKRFTLYELALDSKDPTVYIVDGQPRKMTSKTVEIEVRNADGSISKKQHTLWSSHWGPIVVLPRAGLNWTANSAYALKDANSLNARSADTWHAINKARSVEDIRTALASLGIPWVNTIAADRHGKAMYADVSVVPDVSAEQLRRCTPSKPAAALFALAGLPVLDGSRADCDWNHDSASPVPGITPIARMPVIVRKDWVQNSNDSYWLTNPAEKPRGISPMVGLEDTPQRLRTRIAIEEIRRRLAGQDGLAGKKMGIPEVQAVLFRDRNLAGALVMDDLMAACTNAPSPDAKEGCAALKLWDRTNNLDAKAAHLFREFWRRASVIPGIWRIAFDAADPVATPAGLKFGDAATAGKLWAALEQAVAAVKKAGFSLDAPLGKVQVKPTNRGPVGVHGGDEFEGVLNKVETQGAASITEKGYDPNYGSSYIQAVSFDDHGPVAEAMLTYGQSSNPDSPFAFDQLQLFSRKEWPRLPFHAADVEQQRVGAVLRLVR